jgi:hypothetical protein
MDLRRLDRRRTAARSQIDLSVVVVGYQMSRELPRTLRSLSPAMQRHIDPDRYEIIVIDNGSPEPMPFGTMATWGARCVFRRIDSAAPSPVAAINTGLRLARGSLVGVMIDGARLVTPGLLATALMAARLYPRPVIAVPGFHIGPDLQTISTRNGYGPEAEDRLLEEIGWSEDGYRLFDACVFAGSSRYGWLLPNAETNALFLTRPMWQELDGYDERFVSPGGGYVNLDTYVRACELPDSQLIMLLGEGTFHQVHGGVTERGGPSASSEFHDEYVRIRQKPYAFVQREPIYVGRIPRPSLPFLEQSVKWARARTPEQVGS